jgi:4-hydroxy-tetrahydrodipicolinate reductase
MALVTETSFLYAANFSIGVAVMKRLATIAAEMFRPFPDFQAALVERHHHRKQDAPSGTAKMLGNVVQAAGGVDRLPIVSLRQGGIAGEHSLIFEGQAESLALTHTAHSRQIFAIGAVRAADWLHRERPIGLVSFDNFLERTQTWTVEV